MKCYIHNDLLDIGIDQKGAELKRVFRKDKRIEYLFPGSIESWNRSSPILFPIVGRLKNDQYTYQGKSYHMNQHGFARDRYFHVKEQFQDKISFQLSSDPQSLKMYPWNFELVIEYSLQQNRLMINHLVTNASKEKMFFSLGLHPAFNWPLNSSAKPEDHFLDFNDSSELRRVYLRNGLQSEKTEILKAQGSTNLPLSSKLFEDDALVIKDPNCNSILYRAANAESPSLEISWEDCDYLGIWSKTGGEFICIEPWQGIADSENSSGDITKKEGIRSLAAGASASLKWALKME